MKKVNVIGTTHLANTITECLKTVGYQVAQNNFQDADYIVIAQDTPFDTEHRVDLTPVYEALEQIKNCKGLVIIMSQIPVGTSKKIQDFLKREVVYNPENLRVINGTETYLNADRQVIGVNSKESEREMREFYSWFKNPLLFMSLESAEMTKHAINCFLATSINFINQIEDFSKKVGANIDDVVRGMRSDSRIGEKAYITPGKASKHLCRELRTLESLSLIREVYKINQQR